MQEEMGELSPLRIQEITSKLRKVLLQDSEFQKIARE